jgi:hypothetical protein
LPDAIRDTTGVETASLVNVRTPVIDPAACGVNVMVTTWVVPGASTSGKAGLTMVNPVPLTVPANTVVFPVPGLDMVTVWVCEAPTMTFPK